MIFHSIFDITDRYFKPPILKSFPVDGNRAINYENHSLSDVYYLAS